MLRGSAGQAGTQHAFGHDVDAEPGADYELEYGIAGTAGVESVGTGAVTIDALEDKLDEVRALFEDAFGRDVDAEPDEDADYELAHGVDGTAGIYSAGMGALATDVLEDRLAEVRTLSEDAVGRDVDVSSTRTPGSCMTLTAPLWSGPLALVT